MTQQLHDSGKRRTFKSGAQRDRGDLKPRPDLISPHAQMREGMIHALGSEKYDVRNWERGMPISECLASAQRHIEQFKRGDTDEDHLAQARWNLGAIIHFEEEIKAGRMDPEVDDMPRYAMLEPMLECDELQARVDAGELLSDRENDKLQKHLCDNFGCGTLVKCPECMPEYPDYGSGSLIDPSTFYITGPMRGIKALNFPLFDEVAKMARSQGLSIISPAEEDRKQGIDPIVDPGSVDRAFKADPNLIQTIVRRDCEIIIELNKDRGDGLILLPGWEKSTGGRAEVALAIWLGLQFQYYYPGLGSEPPVMERTCSEAIEGHLFYQEMK